MKTNQQNLNIFDESEVLMKVNNWTVYKSFIIDKFHHKTYLAICNCGKQLYRTLPQLKERKRCQSCSGKKRSKFIQIGSKLGRWTILEGYKIINTNIHQKVKCECGTITFVGSYAMRKGKSNQCRKCSKLTHGHSRSRKNTAEYRTWVNMKTRCNNPKEKSYYNYGGRGIKYDERWKKYENFLEDMGIKPSPELVLDRVDTNDNYYKENCRWVTQKESNDNRRISAKYKSTAFKQSIIDQIKITLNKYKQFYEHEKTCKEKHNENTL